jgi:hypothetical protein
MVDLSIARAARPDTDAPTGFIMALRVVRTMGVNFVVYATGILGMWVFEPAG